MKTEVNALTEVDYALDVHVPADEIEPRIVAVLKQQRGRMNLKGFRPGKVPIQVVRKMIGPQVAVEVAEEVIGEAYRTAVGEAGAYDVVGAPRLSTLDYDPTKAGGDLHAVVKFGVRPQIAIADLDGVPVTKLVRAFTEEDVEADLHRRRETAATVEPAGEGEALTEADVAVVDVQPVDAAGEPAGPVQHGAQILLATPDLRPELKEALVGKTAGETVRVEWEHTHDPDDPEHHDHDHTERYRITVTEVRRRVLPEIDAAWVKEQTGGRTEELDELREEVRAGLEQSWERRAMEAMQEKMVEQFVDAHDFAVPEALVEATLDSRLEEMRERTGGKLPPGFDAAGWRERARESTERQVKWYLVKDALVRHEGLTVTDEDLDAEMARMAGDPDDADLVKAYFGRNPEERDRLVEALLNRRVFDSLSRRFSVVEKTRDDLEREREERQAAEAAEREAAEREAAEREAAEREAVQAGAPAEEAHEEAPKKGLLGRLGFGKKREE
jgi:trigger factor